jgi:hypothetical protein
MDALITQATKRGLVAVGLMLEGASVSLITAIGAVDTGRLRGSITHAVYDHVSETKNRNNRQGDAVSRPEDKFTAHVGTGVEYAAYVEYSTRRMGGRSYLRRALDENKPTCKRLFADMLAEGLRRGK